MVSREAFAALSTILVVEDEESVRELVRMYLENEGFRVETASDGEEALNKVKANTPDLIVLDVMLPKFDGWTVCKEVKKTSSVPIIMLSARAEEFDRVLGLELGADDYIPKPFSPREMVARVRAVLRRTGSNPEAGGRVITYLDLTIDHDASRVVIRDKEVAMTPKEFELLWFLACHPGRVYSREQLLEEVWGYEYLGDARTVDTHIKRLREKLHANDEATYIKTVWGRGYKFEATG
ncbi:MAG: response regulator transcription factor [Bacillota bacterium]